MVVTVNGVASNAVSFTVLPTPSIASLTPNSGPVGALVTIAGTNFGATQGTSTVVFDKTTATPTVWSNTSIQVPVPGGAATGNVVVTVNGVASNGVSFTVLATPNITSLTPTSGALGVSVTIKGTSFGTSQGASTVTFNGTAGTPTSWANATIKVPVPAGATTGYIVVTVNGVPSNGVSFIVPGTTATISSLSPTSGAVGSQVSISGSYFGSSQGTSTVMFNGTVATNIVSWSATLIVATVPSGATSGNVVVTAGGAASNGVSFTVLPTPSIASLAPTSGPAGTSVTVTGTNFGSTQGTSTVTFNGTAATPTSWSATAIVVPVPMGATTGNVVVTVGGVPSNGVSFTVFIGFVPTAGQMEATRYGQTATQLASGQVLIAGGMSTSGVVNSAELYTLTSQTFAATANPMNVARWLHSATLLNDGTVLIAGGSSLSNETTLNSAEIYNPAAGTFTLLPNTLNTARVGHTATLLSNGQVLIVGGYDPSSGIIADSELYDPIARVFIDLGNTNTPRYHHSATLLQNGQVLIAGGETDPTPSAAYNSAEIFNPQTWIFSPLSNMVSPREGHAATLLNDGTVLITGGDNPPSGSLNTAEIYTPATDTFTAVSTAMTSARIFHDAVLLNGGQVLLTGGEDDSSGSTAVLSTAELYNPTNQTFTATPGNMTTAREYQTATLLNDGTVLEDGGTNGSNALSTAEIYTTSQLSGLTSIAIAPATPALPLGSQQLLVATGTFNNGSTQVLSSVLWSSSSTVAAISGDASDNGYVNTLTQGTATITASAAGVSGSSTLTVSAPNLVSITVNPQTISLSLGTAQQFSATGSYSDGSIQDLTSTATWTSSSTAAPVSSAGLVTGAALGTATIQASSGSISNSANVSVTGPALIAVSVSPATAIIALGTTQQYQATGTYTDGSTQNLTNSATWYADPQTSASVSSAGLATATGQGSVTITAVYGSFSGVASLTIGTPNLVSIAISPTTASIAPASQQQFIALASYSDGSTQDITSSASWSSSSGTVATVNASGLTTADGGGSTTITASSGSVSGTAALTVATGTPTLNTSRYQHNATLLNNGTVLFAGGTNCPSAGSCTYLNSAELYNPNSGTITNTAGMATARTAPAILLGNGKVLVAGGYNCDSNGNCASLSSAEIYDPVAGTFSSAGNMTIDRYGHSMTLLAGGQVLIAGGETCSSATSCTALSTAEIYDPVAGTFTSTGSLNNARFNASAIALTSGQVLIAGGFNGTNDLTAAELYTPASATFSLTGSLNFARDSATATLLDSGQVLIAGGSTCGSSGCPTAVSETYINGAFSYAGSMLDSRYDQTATLLTNGQILIAGGYDSCASSSCTSDGTTEIFQQAYIYTPGPALSTGRSGHTATLLTDGSVLMVGGINNGVTLSSTDSYQPSSLALPQLATIVISPSNVPVAVGATLSLTATGYASNSSIPMGTLPSVIWNSSSPSVATVSNAAGSAGIVSGLSTGSTTISATVGTIIASTTITVTATLVSIAITPPNPSVAVSTTQFPRLTATGTYADGSTLDLTADASWTSANTAIATVYETVGNPALLLPESVGSTTITASYGGITGSTTVTVNSPLPPASPMVTGVSPNSGEPGTAVTITGTGFGVTQGSGLVWLGTNLGSVVSWSDTQVIATVTTGSSSGVAEIQQGSMSNSLPFTIDTATIASIYPTSGLTGTQVTISGSGFGSAQGSGSVWLGTVPAIVNSWSDGQVVATVASGAASGNVLILQNGVMSNAVPFTINVTQITSINPNSGPDGTSVTINGNNFGGGTCSGGGGGGGGSSVRGGSQFQSDYVPSGGYVWIGSNYASVTSWCNTKIVATVASGSVTGVAKVQLNGTWSNGLTFIVPPVSGTSVNLVPNIISMATGNAQTIEAINSSGQSVTGLTWTSSNTAVVTLSTDDPPILTAVAPGNATILAGGASADVTVYAGTVPLGTTIWSNPGDGSGIVSAVPAVPSAPVATDVFALNSDCNVQAVNSSGTVAWTANIGQILQYPYYSPNPGPCSEFMPDFQGGLMAMSESATNTQFQYSIQKFDGTTGQPYPAYTEGVWWPNLNFWYAGFGYNTVETYPPTVVHPNGTIFTVVGEYSGNDGLPNGFTAPGVAVINPLTGIAAPLSFDEFPSNYSTPASIGGFGSWIVGGDGYAYLPYSYFNGTQTSPGTQSNPCGSGFGTTYLAVMRLDTSANASVIILGQWDTQYSSCLSGTLINPTQVSLITNADQGIAASWVLKTGVVTCECQVGATNTYYLATTSGTSLASQTVTQQLLTPVLQRADGSFVGLASIPGVSGNSGSSMAAFTSAGNILWSVPNDSPVMASADGGVVGLSGNTYDQNGNADGYASGATQSWSGNSYTDGPLTQVAVNPINPAGSFWPFQLANASANAAAGLVETVYVRSFAPWLWFGPEPQLLCAYNCFRGDNRSFSTSLDVTSRISGVLKFLVPSMTIVDANATSSPSSDVYGRTKTAIDTHYDSNVNGTLNFGFSGHNPLIIPQALSPDIDTNLVLIPSVDAAPEGQVCYYGSLYGDAFPNAEVFVVNSQNQATMLLTFTTPGSPNAGPFFYLPGDGIDNMGAFSSICLPR